MSSNNQLVIKKSKGKYEIHINNCVDNPFKSNKSNLIKIETTLEKAVKFAQNYEREEMIEYGTYIDTSCWRKK